MKRQLPHAGPGKPMATILDRALAAAHGPRYVQLCAFAVDVDRVYCEVSTEAELLFGWEVFLTESYIVGQLAPVGTAEHALLEDTCLFILEQPPERQGYGSQLLFAVYDAIERELLPKTLRGLFRSWRKRPKQLRQALDRLWSEPAAKLDEFAGHCLESGVELAAPTRRALAGMRAGAWPMQVP